MAKSRQFTGANVFRKGDGATNPNNRSFFFIVFASGTGTIRFGDGDGNIPMGVGDHYSPPKGVNEDIHVTGTGTYIIHTDLFNED